MANSLAGKRILVIEDEYFIASDLKRALQDENAVVVGPVGDLNRGLTLTGGETLDAAVLDINLEGASSFPIADRLSAQGVPYLFLTGYDDQALPQQYRTAPHLLKPFSLPAVIACVGRLVEGGPQ